MHGFRSYIGWAAYAGIHSREAVNCGELRGEWETAWVMICQLISNKTQGSSDMPAELLRLRVSVVACMRADGRGLGVGTSARVGS